MQQNVYTVSQINTYIKNMFTQDYVCAGVQIQGEVSNCKYHTSGHIYFTLKDKGGTISCVMFAGQRGGLLFKLQEGQSVIVSGSISVYERDGKYQVYAREIVLSGEGILYQKFEQLKRELQEMGMFAREYKQPIPRFVKRLGVVTASTGAAIRDIMNISYRRNPYIQIILYPALVQGEGATDSIVKGLQILDRADVDVIIVGRGGGSLEDLWAFNEEKVARAIFDCQTPVISAVGHETDTTIADFVADLRAPTPSAAAELAVCDIQAVQMQLADYGDKCRQLLEHRITDKKRQIEAYRLRLLHAGPHMQLKEKRHAVLQKREKLQYLFKSCFQRKKQQYQLYIEQMKGLSPLYKLNQGYSYVSDEQSRAVTSIQQVEEGQRLFIHVTDGTLQVVTEKKEAVRREKNYE